MSLNEVGKFIALILRHKPEAIGITLDEHGWANVDDLIAGIAKKAPFDRTMLEEIVKTDEKQGGFSYGKRDFYDSSRSSAKPSCDQPALESEGFAQRCSSPAQRGLSA